MAKNAVVVKFLADVDGLKKGVDGIDKKLNGFSKGLKGFALAFGAAFSAKAVIDFSKASVSAFSDFEEAAGKVGQVFQEQASIVERWSQSAVEDIGLSSQAALEAAGTFGNLFTAFGVGIPQAREMSITLTELAADLASFNNTSIDQAINALRAGLSGETEPLKRYGVALNQAAIEAEAMALGLYDGKDAIDASAKSQAIYSLTLKQTTNAQGDFKRTQDGLANTQRTINAAFEEAKKTIGEGLYNAIVQLTDAIGGPEGAAETIDVLATRLGLWVEGAASAIKATGGLEGAMEDVSRETRQLADDFVENGEGARAWFKLIGDLTKSDSTISILEVLGQVEKQTRDSNEAFNNLNKVKFADHLSGELEATARAARAVEIEANSASRALRRLFLSNPDDALLRNERQGDSFLRQFNDDDSAWRDAKEQARDLASAIDDVGTSAGGTSRAVEDSTKKVKSFTAQIGDFTLSVAQKAAKGKKISADAIKAMTQAGQEAIQGLLDDLAKAEAQLVETQKFIAQQTANFLGPTSVKAVQQAYAAAKSEYEQLERAANKATEAREKAQAGGSETDAQKARIAELSKAEQDAINKAADAYKKQEKGFKGFWEEAQASVVAYRAELDKLRKEFEADGIITDAEAQIFQDVFSLPPDVGTDLINDLLTESGRALVANQQTIIDDTNAWMTTITDTFAGKNGFPAVGYTAASTMVEDLNKELTSKKTKKKIRQAVRAAVPKSVKVKVEWEYAPFQPNIPSSVNSSRSRTIQDIQSYERMNGSKWRDRVR